ncbi:MAG: PSD1 domain-containing protein [Pirellulaceae bacterium]|nr:PSD1 domain-containing protein [Pirellulaceae bacterium]
MNPKRLACALIVLCAQVAVAQPAPQADEWFETHIRPLLAQRCLECHSQADNQTEGGLALDTAEGWQRGGGRGPAIIPHQPAASLFLIAVEYGDPELQMPPDGKLSQAEVDLLTQWIKHGAHDPRQGSPRIAGMTRDEADGWWSLQPLPLADQLLSSLPKSNNRTSNANSIDLFVEAALENAGLGAVGQADPRSLIRRVTYDLTGLPPTPEEVDAFVADHSPPAYAQLIDRLLASPRYGQRWARHWLDVMRYADYLNLQTGDHRQGSVVEYYEAWKYRDWVVAALNADLPYNKFIHAQVAGDTYPRQTDGTPDHDALIATTWMALGPWDNGDADKHKIVSDIVDDQINTVGQSLLGMTIACARCHDHKFDPITIEDYYGLAGIFYSSCVLHSLGAKGAHTEALRIPIAPPELVERRQAQLAAIAAMEKRLKQLEAAPNSKTTTDVTFDATQANESAQAQQPADQQRLTVELEQARAELLPEPPMALAVREGGTPGGLFPGIQDVPVHRRGKYYELAAETVPRGLPRFLAAGRSAAIQSGSGRAELADWLVALDNPLTARVVANRVWQWHFGRGLVATPNNFGKLGQPPTHPELLDYLAVRLIQSGWSLKSLHRDIMLSAAYQRATLDDTTVSTDVGQRMLELDADNRLLARFSSRRLEAEEIRDTLLLVSGQLDEALGGPAADSFFSPRRSLYVQSTRYHREYFGTLFDAADNEQPVEMRNASTGAPQSLFFLNHPFLTQASHRLATRLYETTSDRSQRIEQLFRIVLGRSPTSVEREMAGDWLTEDVSQQDVRLVELCNIVLCTNELIYVD